MKMETFFAPHIGDWRRKEKTLLYLIVMHCLNKVIIIIIISLKGKEL